jgi:hypothetical protein
MLPIRRPYPPKQPTGNDLTPGGPQPHMRLPDSQTIDEGRTPAVTCPFDGGSTGSRAQRHNVQPEGPGLGMPQTGPDNRRQGRDLLPEVPRLPASADRGAHQRDSDSAPTALAGLDEWGDPLAGHS